MTWPTTWTQLVILIIVIALAVMTFTWVVLPLVDRIGSGGASIGCAITNCNYRSGGGATISPSTVSTSGGGTVIPTDVCTKPIVAKDTADVTLALGEATRACEAKKAEAERENAKKQLEFDLTQKEKEAEQKAELDKIRAAHATPPPAATKAPR